MLSAKFIVRLKLSKLKQYQIARIGNLHPSTLSKLVNGIEKGRRGDPRLLRIGVALGLKKEEVFLRG